MDEHGLQARSAHVDVFHFPALRRQRGKQRGQLPRDVRHFGAHRSRIVGADLDAGGRVLERRVEAQSDDPVAPDGAEPPGAIWLSQSHQSCGGEAFSYAAYLDARQTG